MKIYTRLSYASNYIKFTSFIIFSLRLKAMGKLYDLYVEQKDYNKKKFKVFPHKIYTNLI